MACVLNNDPYNVLLCECKGTLHITGFGDIDDITGVVAQFARSRRVCEGHARVVLEILVQNLG